MSALSEICCWHSLTRVDPRRRPGVLLQSASGWRASMSTHARGSLHVGSLEFRRKVAQVELPVSLASRSACLDAWASRAMQERSLTIVFWTALAEA